MTPVNATQYADSIPPPKKKISLLRMIADRNSDKRTKLRYYSIKRKNILTLNYLTDL